MAASPMIIGVEQKRLLAALRQHATDNPVDITAVLEQLKTPKGHAQHIERMNGFTIDIPVIFKVTFTIETQHPAGTCRHLSVSSRRRGRFVTPEACWMVAEELGFVGGIEACTWWPEEFMIGDQKIVAMNLVQPVSMTAPGRPQ